MNMDANKRLEEKMVKYRDLIAIPVKDCGEVLVPLTSLPYGYVRGMADMKDVFGNSLIVRKSVYEKLLKAQKMLEKRNPNYSLYITYGYRTLEIQTKRFLKQLKIVSTQFYPCADDLYEAVHRSVAVPTVAGHPTGGAVDLYIIDKISNMSLDFGSKIYDYTTKKYYVFSEDISKKQKKNRHILRSVMLKVGFAPYDGEWWHFSYGDREWAFYYKKRFSLFSDQ